jgi:signal transduction histidine kinase
LSTWTWQVSLLAFLYAVFGLFGLELTHYHDSATLFWPATGLSLAALILFGTRLWPGIFLGVILVNLVGSLSWPASLGVAIGNTLEAFVGATLLIRFADFRPDLERQRDWLAYLVIGVLGCTTLSATVGTSSLLAFEGLSAITYWRVWLIWWFGNVGGALVAGPALMMLVHGTPAWRFLVRRLEFWIVLGLLVATSCLAFLGPDLGRLGFAMVLAPFPFLTWAGTRFGPRGAMATSSVAIAIAVAATGLGLGPLVLATTAEAMLLLWSYSILIGIAAFTLAAVVEQRNVAERKYRSEEINRLDAEKQKMLLLERNRLTRELHDGLGGQLVSVLSMVERGHAVPSEVAEALRRAIDDIGIVVDSLDPEFTDFPTSLSRLRDRLEPLLRRNGVALRWDVENVPGMEAFPPAATLNLLRIIQEAVTNTLRHANADIVEIKITSSDRLPRARLHVEINDDGRGPGPGLRSGGRGVRNMKARAEELGADLKIESANSGTRIELTIPLPDEASTSAEVDHLNTLLDD